MKAFFLFLVVACQCMLYGKCFKFRDSDLIPARFLRRSDIDDLLLSSNRQKSLYPETDSAMTENYQKTLDAIAAQAILANAVKSNKVHVLLQSDDEYDDQDQYSEELHLDDFIPDNDEDDFGFKNDPKDEETETHSSLIAGHQYVSGGAGEGKQYLHPDGAVDNKEEVKSDEDLPAYCDPPNPCPVGYVGEDCDLREYAQFTAEYSKSYQEQQNCMCDDDHNVCQGSGKTDKSLEKMSEVMENLKQADVSSLRFFVRANIVRF